MNVRRATLEDVPFVAEMLDEATAFVRTKGRDHKLAVRRAFAGRGLGARIVEWLDGDARRRGRAFIRLDCQRDLPGIRRYYEQLGFELRGELERGEFAWALYERPVRA